MALDTVRPSLQTKQSQSYSSHRVIKEEPTETRHWARKKSSAGKE